MERTRVTSDEARTASEGRECACEVCVRVRVCVCVCCCASPCWGLQLGGLRGCANRPAGVDGPVVGVRGGRLVGSGNGSHRGRLQGAWWEMDVGASFPGCESQLSWLLSRYAVPRNDLQKRSSRCALRRHGSTPPTRLWASSLGPVKGQRGARWTSPTCHRCCTALGPPVALGRLHLGAAPRPRPRRVTAGWRPRHISS